LREQLTEALEQVASSKTELEALLAEAVKPSKKVATKKAAAKKAPPSMPARTPRATKKAKKEKQPSDNLCEIKGVGPKMSEALTKMGVTSYKQIANLKPADLPDFAEKAGTTAARIKRDKWIAGAKAQHKAKYGVKA